MKLRKQAFGEDYYNRDIDVFGGGVNEKRKIKRMANKARRRDDKNIQNEQAENGGADSGLTVSPKHAAM
ncbi:MAG: hypothetical protein FWG52_07990 [Proteobacteria bacterium]|nr:hypothetical protein [Pseudomonadota bacterium]